MARKKYLETTLKRLFALSGNQCAFPGCTQRMVDEHGNVHGEICHIEAANLNGERYNAQQTDEERRAFENLMLLCSNHHLETNNVVLYTVEALKKMKAEHEAKFVYSPFTPSKEVIQQARSMLAEKVTTTRNIKSPHMQTIIADGHAYVDQRGATFYQSFTVAKPKRKNEEARKEIEAVTQSLSNSLGWLISVTFPVVICLLCVQVLLPIALILAEMTEPPLLFPLGFAPIVIVMGAWYLAYPIFRLYLWWVGFSDLPSDYRNQVIRKLKKQHEGDGIFARYRKVCLHALKFDKRHRVWIF